MSKTTFKLNCFVAIFFLIPMVTYGQDVLTPSGLKEILTAITDHAVAEQREDVYIQQDKPYYTTGDTIWYKAYVLERLGLKTGKQSGLLYMSVHTDQGLPVKYFIQPLIAGVGWGNFVLNEGDFPAGNYTLRAYTNWMRNYAETAVFTRNFYVSGNQTLLVKASTVLNSVADSALLKLSLQEAGGGPASLKYFRLKIRRSGQTLLSGKAQTETDGSVQLNFPLPAKALGQQVLLSLSEESKEKDKFEIVMPLVMMRPSELDVQFMPEGGNLVAGIGSRVGVKVLGGDGSSVQVSGDIIDESNKTVSTFITTYKGMGSFLLTPSSNRRYTARIKIGSSTAQFPLPATKTEGTVLSVSNPLDTQVLEVRINSTTPGETYYLLGESRGMGCYAGIIRMKGTTYNLSISKEAFPSGIAKLTLLNQNRKPVNERQVYIDHHDNLKISTRLNKVAYGTRDSVSVSLEVRDSEDQPVVASLSLSVTDNGQVRTTGADAENIVNRFLLTAGLRGEIETPGHYLSGTEKAWQDLDVLLLTQGWSSYDWSGLFSTRTRSEPKYKAEPEFNVTGRVINAFGKGVAGTEVSLLSSIPLLVKDTLTDDKGRFIFRSFPPIENPAFKIKAVNRRGKSFNVGIEVDRQEPMSFHTPARIQIPWNANMDTLTRSKMLSRLKMDQEDEQLMARQNGNTLKEVVISAKKMVKGSHNLNGIGNADQVLDEKDILKAGKMTLLEVLNKQVKGFSWTTDHFTLNGQPLHFIFDGINLEENESMSLLDVMNILKYYNAEDIIGLEMMYNMSNTMKYNTEYKPNTRVSYVVNSPAYMEITTRSKKGPFMSNIPGMYVYKSIPFAWPKQEFYSPKYSKKDNVGQKDKRSTLFWEPNVVTGSDGKANLSFYTSDMPGNYTFTLEGSDMNGNIGAHQKIIVVNK